MLQNYLQGCIFLVLKTKHLDSLNRITLIKSIPVNSLGLQVAITFYLMIVKIYLLKQQIYIYTKQVCSMKYILILFAILQCYFLQSQCTYLAYDGFDYSANMPMEGAAGGTGWDIPWNVQNEDETVPGYNAVASSLPYSDLQVTGNSASGGFAYLTMGRRLNTSDSGPFSDYVSQYDNGIGTATGDTLWTSFVLSKDVNNDQSAMVSMHTENLAWCDNCTSEKIAIGYFGTNSNTGGQRYWTLQLNNTYHLSSVAVSINQPTFFVVRTIFEAGDTQVDLFINPATIGNNGIPSPTLSQSTGSENVIRSIAANLGGSPNSARLDEFRMGTSYPCVTPDPDIVVNLPPTAIISMTPSSGMAPLSVTLEGSSSFDPENQPLTYLWDFGDGSATSNMENPALHVYDAIGELTVSLTVTDDSGQAHTIYETLTVLDSDGSFPCQATITCLQMTSCNANNGIIRVNAGNNPFVFKNELNQIINPTTANEFHNLSAGSYTAIVSGASSVCSDSFNLQITTDSTTCSGWQPPMCAMGIGTNMSRLADWSVERPFRNLMKNVREGVISYSDACFCWDANVTDEMLFDTSGYPTFLPQPTSIGATMVRFVISSNGGNLRPDSSYILLYDGIGVIDILGSNVQSNVPNRIEFIAGTGNIIINIEQSTNGDHLRNFRVLTLADENTDLIIQPFYQSFTDKIEPFSVLRFMDWGVTNHSPLTIWSDRSSENFFTYATDAGVPYEMMIQLANQLQQDIWICIPHQADDNFISEMATLFREGLDEDLTIYLEYSNEVWNWIFDQAHYNNENKPSNLSYGRAMAQKAKNVFDIWHNEFSGEECRVKRVLGIQGGFTSLNEEILSQLNSEDWDYGSPTHYFGLDHSDQGNPVLDASSTYQDVMLNTSNSFAAFSQLVKQDYRNVQVYGKEVITYEGGQHFVGNSFGIPYDYQNAMWEAQNSQEMYDMYDALHDSIRSWGCKLATNFSLATVQASVYGSWGVLPDIDVLPPYAVTAKKYQALLDNLPDSTCSNINIWTGELSTNWSNPCNWDKNRIPLTTDNVHISALTPHQPSVDMAGHAKSVNLSVDAMLRILAEWNLVVH
jgi:hypothetical protein